MNNAIYWIHAVCLPLQRAYTLGETHCIYVTSRRKIIIKKLPEEVIDLQITAWTVLFVRLLSLFYESALIDDESAFRNITRGKKCIKTRKKSIWKHANETVSSI